MIIHLNFEAIYVIRDAILECASELSDAIDCENRFNETLIVNTMGTLEDVIRGVDGRFEGMWFSARVRVPGVGIQMLTTPEERSVSNLLYWNLV